MFDRDSRYAKREIKTYVDVHGREIVYVKRRFIPKREAVAELPVQPGDRLGIMAHRAYGDPRQFWRIADANIDSEPSTLTDTPGRRLKLYRVEPE